MRVATWNVNSLKARMDRLMWWLDRAQPDVLLMQETKLSDEDAPVLPLRMRGYDLVHHGEGRWNGVAIASRLPVDAESVVTNFGDGPVRDSGPGADRDFAAEDFNPFDEARMLSATIDGIRFVCLYAPNGRVVGSPFYTGKLAWYDRLSRWLAENVKPGDQAIVGGDMNVAPTPDDVWNEAAAHGGTHVSPLEREAFADVLSRGFVDGYRASRAASRGGTIARATSTRTWACASTTCCCHHRSRSGSCSPRSIARRARACPFRPITPRSSSIWTSPVSPWMPGGRALSNASPPGPGLLAARLPPCLLRCAPPVSTCPPRSA
jgi:exodeoxyribonuclease-3